jgi:hypothetical protein
MAPQESKEGILPENIQVKNVDNGENRRSACRIGCAAFFVLGMAVYVIIIL